jgi:iron complex outermembrane receptor protein
MPPADSDGRGSAGRASKNLMVANGGRIEVIKSPISTLYGANAFSGVINFITKTPGEIKGTQVNLSQGSL